MSFRRRSSVTIRNVHPNTAAAFRVNNRAGNSAGMTRYAVFAYANPYCWYKKQITISTGCVFRSGHLSGIIADKWRGYEWN